MKLDFIFVTLARNPKLRRKILNYLFDNQENYLDADDQDFANLITNYINLRALETTKVKSELLDDLTTLCEQDEIISLRILSDIKNSQ